MDGYPGSMIPGPSTPVPGPSTPVLAHTTRPSPYYPLFTHPPLTDFSLHDPSRTRLDQSVQGSRGLLAVLG